MTPNKENHSSVISFNIKGVHPHDVASILDAQGVCIRSRKPLCTTTYEILRSRFHMPSKFLFLQHKRRSRQTSTSPKKSIYHVSKIYVEPVGAGLVSAQP